MDWKLIESVQNSTSIVKSDANLIYIKMRSLSINLLEQAQIFFARQDYAQAETKTIKLLQVEPDNIQAIRLLAQIGVVAGDYQKVLPLLERCTLELPDDAQILLQLAQVRAECGLLKDAEQSFMLLIEKFPDWASAHFYYSGFLQSLGRLQETRQSLEQTIAIDPSHASAYLALVNLGKSANDKLLLGKIDLLLSQLKQSQSQQQDQMKLYYAIGKLKAEQQDYQGAFESWLKANAIQLTFCNFRVKQMVPFYEQLTKNFKGIDFSSSQNIKPVEDSIEMIPIFIVGLPRSGTTLLEQMLLRHSKVCSIGETTIISDNVVSCLQQMTGTHYPFDIHKLKQQQWKQLGDVYLKEVTKREPSAQYIIDKLPANFQSIGLIKKILPNAKIINVNRQAEAIAISTLRNYFAQNEPYFCDLQEFTEYHAQYQQLMSFWSKQLKQAFYNLDYENLVIEPEEELKRVLKYCQLDWEKGCLNPQAANNRITTLSDTQARKPIYRSSLNDWKNYCDELSEFSRLNSK